MPLLFKIASLIPGFFVSKAFVGIRQLFRERRDDADGAGLRYRTGRQGEGDERAFEGIDAHGCLQQVVDGDQAYVAMSFVSNHTF